MFFFFTPPVFHCFFGNVNACSPLTGIIRVFSHVGRDLPRNQPRPATYYTVHYVRSKVERSRACTPLTQKTVWDSGFFAHALFLPKKRKVMGFSGSVNGATKNPGFLDGPIVIFGEVARQLPINTANNIDKSCCCSVLILQNRFVFYFTSFVCKVNTFTKVKKICQIRIPLWKSFCMWYFPIDVSRRSKIRC